MKGKVYLVGAGPGDYKLMTLRGLDALKKADIIIYDRLANETLLKEAKETCEFIYVGKKSSDHTMKQEDINELIAKKAEEGKTVVRLKGGDPYVFGRGGEEGEVLYERGIDFEVIPGITSAIGGLCYAGIPITHRDYASSFHVITGHLKEDGEELNWNALASLKGTLVFLMGMSNLENIVNNLMDNGKPIDTPVAIINWASRSNQRVVIGNLENIYKVVQREGIKPPSLIVIGDVVRLRDKLNYFEKKPLFGKNIVVTRARAQSSRLVEEINDLGGSTIEFPTIKINEIPDNNDLHRAIENIEKYNYIIFTSKNGVEIFFDNLFKMGFDSRKLGKAKVVAIGPATNKALVKWGIKSDIIPETYVGESIYDELKIIVKTNDNILIPRSKEARSYLVDSLSPLCNVNEVQTYETLLGNGDRDEILRYLDNDEIDYITFTSSSTVRNFIEILGMENIKKLAKTKMISIGPITSKTIQDLGLEIYKEAESYTIDGMLECLVNE